MMVGPEEYQDSAELLGQSGRFNKTFFILALVAVPVLFLLALIWGLADNFTSPGLVVLATILFAFAVLNLVVVTSVFVYRSWALLRDLGFEVSPGKAVGFLFIPVFNLYWVFQAFWGFSRLYNQFIDEQYLDQHKLPEKLFLSFSILLVLSPVLLFIPLLNLVTALVTYLLLIILVAQGCEIFSSLEQAGVVPALPKEDLAYKEPGEKEAVTGGRRSRRAKLAGGALALVILLLIIFLAYPRPDIVVEALSVPDEVIHGDEIVITAEAANTGRAEGDYSATLFIEDKEVETKEFSLGPGDSELLQFSFPVEYAPAVYPLYLGLGPERERTEELETSFQVLEPYVITDFDVPGEIVHGEEIVVTAGVENVSSVQIPYGVTLFVDGAEAETRELNLESGSQELLEFDLTGKYGTGEYTLALGIGPEKSVDEHLTHAMRILKPAEFVIRAFSLSSEVINLGDDLEAKITVANVGEVEGDYTVEIEQNDEIIKSEDVTLDGGDEEELVLSLTVNNPGSHNFSVGDNNRDLTVYQIERPGNGTILVNRISGGRGHMRVNNNHSGDLVMVLSRPDEPQTPSLAVYVRGESSTTVTGIRDGNYITYYSFGEDWDSHSKRFTRNASHGKYEDQSTFTTSHYTDRVDYTIWTFDFGVIGLEDPARTESVSPEDFPSF